MAGPRKGPSEKSDGPRERVTGGRMPTTFLLVPRQVG